MIEEKRVQLNEELNSVEVRQARLKRLVEQHGIDKVCAATDCEASSIVTYISNKNITISYIKLEIAERILK